MKSLKFLLPVLIVLFLFVGCVRPYNRPAVVQIETNETAFLVDMRSDGSATASAMAKIQRKDVQIDGYWVQTGRFGHIGYWRPAQRVLVVSRRPVRVVWSAADTDPTIRAVSKESVGFKVPLIINATISSDDDASRYLEWFKSNENSQAIPWETLTAAEWPVREEAQSLEEAINRVIFPKVNDALSSMFIEVSIIECEQRRIEFVQAAFELAKEEAAKYGITLIGLSSTDGLLYDDPSFQTKINEFATAQMQEKVLGQQRINAQALQAVQTTEARTATLVAQEKAAQSAALQRLQEIENSRMIAEATAKGIESGNIVPSGSYPKGLTTLIVTPNYNSLGR